ncbi:hypothetical protein K2173_004921 [Erythroxylum novogranatense]|uniref:TF-B3 domain-containing protein n=1 Tax=Erythroxylum novogranatense TaxID=1862640 RepID=A0AAV8U9K9_9ROSI|nr:hypothetical protein K2173_004921 [Erythroxylum novogranatense]
MMNLVEEERGYCDKEELQEEEEEEEEEEEVVMTSKLSFPSPNSPSSSNQYKIFLPQHQTPWLGSSEARQDYNNQEPNLNFDKKKMEIMELSLGNNCDESETSVAAGTSSGSVEKEHMFDKVVTPSDVGKLNRLVIPKQHAEKCFPLDSSSSEKGLILNFEDRSGKQWRFRYSYWNSSQSYVMTKGWSRFVKEKKLDAGDIVSFQRGVGESGRHRLYIDWRRRTNAPDPMSFSHLELQNQLHLPQSMRWGRHYSMPQSLSIQPRPFEYHQQPQFQHLNFSTTQPYHYHNHHNHHHFATGYANAVPYYLRPSGSHQIEAMHPQQARQQVPMVIESVPIVHGKTVGKRLRLFGVNMECPIQDDSSSSSSSISPGTIAHGTVASFSPHLASASIPRLQSMLPASASTATNQAEFSKRGKTSSFDLDL